MSHATATTTASDTHSSGRAILRPTSLSELVSAHPAALRALYATGSPTQPAELGPHPRGRLLSLSGDPVFLLLRPLVRALASDGFPWKGKVFHPESSSGENIVLGKPIARFHTEVGKSEIDGAPTLLLRYGEPSFNNPWPVRAIVDELRTISNGIAIGPAFLSNKGIRHCILWFGLEYA